MLLSYNYNQILRDNINRIFKNCQKDCIIVIYVITPKYLFYSLMKKHIYTFLNNKAEGSASMKNILGGKGANLAEMTNLGIPVPPGFTISSDVCVYFMNHDKYPPGFKKQVHTALEKIESFMGKKFGDYDNPLLLSVRSGARQSMPGMMETVLNIGLNSNTAKGLIHKTNNPKFVYDSFRRLIMMYADVVMEKSSATDSVGIRLALEKILENLKSKNNYQHDSDLSADELFTLCKKFKKKIVSTFKVPFPEDPTEQLWGAIAAVFQSWNGKRAIDYRNIEKIPHTWGTAVNIQCMVFGNMGSDSATGVAFTRNPSTGEKKFFGEWLKNAQGEDVVAGIRTPHPIYNNTKKDLKNQLPSMYAKLDIIQKKLEKHYREMQDLEFTIQENNLWILQTREGKRNGVASIKIALDMYREKLHTKKTMLSKINHNHINEILLPTIDKNKLKNIAPIAIGLPAGPGSATGCVVFSPDEAEVQFNKGKDVILVREETSPEDIHGMYVANAILTSRGGMTSHAALVARGWGKCCIVGCHDIQINYKKKFFLADNKKIKEGDWITLNGSKGTVYDQKLPLVKTNIKKNHLLQDLLRITKSSSKLLVRTNADSPADALTAIELGASGIGLCRTEHMFFDPIRIKEMRKMILATNEDERRQALMRILPFQKNDFYKILKAMNGLPVTIRLLDPPLHEFLPTKKEQIKTLAHELGCSVDSLLYKIETLHEANPMLGHRGCRLGITYPEITEMQTKAIIQATVKLIKEGYNPKPEIMIPLVGNIGEFINQKTIVQHVIESIQNQHKIKKLNIKIGTMIELPRACLIADQIAKEADFISFGTNDLTQTTFGFSRDDIGSFLPDYLNQKIMPNDPFQTLDHEGVGELVRMAISKSRRANPNIKIGVCGEHGGDPNSIKFLVSVGVDYVSCSPYRVPIASLTLAQIS